MSNTVSPTMIEFTPDDLLAAVMIIDLACQQGAFRGWDNIEKAYTVRERILAFAEQWKSAVSPSVPNNTAGDTQ